MIFLFLFQSNKIKSEKNSVETSDSSLNSVSFLGVVQDVIGGKDESEVDSELPPEDDKEVQVCQIKPFLLSNKS